MIYDKVQHFDLVFSEYQEVGSNNIGFTREYMQRVNQQLREANNGKPVIRANNLKEFGIGVLGFIASLILAFVLTIVLPCGKHLVFHMGAAFLCGFLGFVKIKGSNSYNKIDFCKDKTADIIAGSLLIAEAAAILIMWFNLPFATDWECSYFMAGVFLIVMGVYNATGLIMHLTRGIRIYTEKVEAECIGYVRKRKVSSDSYNHKHINWYHSPVFRYFTDGHEMTAFYDTLSRGIDSNVAKGPVTISINRNDPGAIMNPSTKGMIGSLIIIAALLLIGVFFVYAVLHGGVRGSSIGI